jgi:PKD repeat protein
MLSDCVLGINWRHLRFGRKNMAGVPRIGSIGMSVFLASLLLPVPSWPLELPVLALNPPPQEWALKFMRAHSAVAPAAAAFNLGPSFTLEAWIFLEADSPETIIMGKGHDAAGDDPFASYALTFAFGSGRRVQFVQTTGAPGSLRVVESSEDIPLRTWTHLAGVLDGGVMRLYVNGEEAAQGTSAGAPEANLVPFALGGWPEGTTSAMWGFLYGSLRQARVWSRALSAEEVRAYAQQALTGAESGLVACWPLDDGGDSSTAADCGPHFLPLTISSAPGSYPTPWTHTLVLNTGPFFQVQHFEDLVAGPGRGFGPLSTMDFDHDGFMDLLVETVEGGSLSSLPYRALRNDGTGHFQDVSLGAFLPSAPSPFGVSDPIVADFDADGIEDLFLPDYGLDWTPETPGQALLLAGTASGHLTDVTATHLPQVLNKPHDAAAGDLRGLGVPDIFIGNIGVPPTFAGHGSELYLNDGHGYFTSDVSLIPPEARGYYTGSQFLDADGDGNLDLWLGSGEPASFPDKLLVNKGGGDLVVAPAWALPPIRGYDRWMSLYAHSADLDGDGSPDLAFDSILNYDNWTHLFRVLLNNGDGTFREASDRVPQRAGSFYGRHAVGDFNADGRADLALTVAIAATVYTSRTSLLMNIGRGQFLDETELLGFDNLASGQVAADFDNDGLLDLVDFYADLALAKAVKPFIPPVEWTRNFTVDPSPTKLFLEPGTTGSLNAGVRSLNGFTGSAMVSASFSPASPYVSVAVPAPPVAFDGNAPVNVTVAPNAPVGVYWLWVTAESGGISHTTTLPVIVYRPSAEAAPGSESDPFATSFVAQAEGFDGLKGAPSIDWNFGDGSPHGNSATATHAYATPGSYTWTVTVSNGLATRNRTGSVTVPWSCALAGSASASVERGNAPLAVAFTAQVAPYFCSGASPVYRWDFGDGTSSVEQNPEKIYSVPGVYPWTVTATAAGRNWTRNGWVTVGGLAGQAGALGFKGAQVAQGPITPLLNLGSTFTVEAWLYLPDLPLPDRGTLLGKRWEDLGGTPSLSYVLDVISDGRPQFQQCTADGSGCFAPYSETSVGKRHGVHVAATDDGTTGKLYVNGVMVGSSGSPGAPDPAAIPFAIGGSVHVDGSLGWAPLTGLLWDIRIWNHALTQEELVSGMGQRLMGNEPGLIAWWPLDDGAGQVARDRGPHHLDLMLGTTPGADAADPEWVDLSAPCRVTCTGGASVSGGVAPLLVSFSSSGSASGLCGNGAVAYQWDFGDGSDPVAAQNPSHTYASPGTFTWTLTASSGGVSCTRTGTVTVTPPPPCTLACTATVPSSAPAEQAVTFSSTVSPSHCYGSATFDWSFGDGSAHSALQNPSHVYTLPGTFTWTLTVAQDGATCTKTGSITVTPPAAPPIITSLAKMNPFAIKVAGSNLQQGVRVFINGTEWTTVTWKNTTKLTLGGGKALKAAVPKGIQTQFRFLNPDGGEASTLWGW